MQVILPTFIEPDSSLRWNAEGFVNLLAVHFMMITFLHLVEFRAVLTSKAQQRLNLLLVVVKIFQRSDDGCFNEQADIAADFANQHVPLILRGEEVDLYV